MITVNGLSFSTSGKTHLVLVANHPPFKDPRIEWQVGNASPDDSFICIGLHDDPAKETTVAHSRRNVVEITRYRYEKPGNLPVFSHNLRANAFRALLWRIGTASDEEIDAEFGTGERTAQFRSVTRYFAASVECIVGLIAGIKGVSSIIATDVDSLLAALVLRSAWQVPVIFDAHEIYYDSLTFNDAEKAFWHKYEKLALTETDRRFITSPTAARFMEEHYGHSFDVMPNCEPLRSLLPRPPRKPGPCRFLFQGVIGPTRGLLLLIDAWHRLKSDAVLIIRGPQNPDFYPQLTAAAGDLTGSKILFPPPVSESELVGAASEADIGIISYEPVNANNRLCCPNKLSQYMAAGIPVLANDLPVVRQIIEDGKCGVLVDFRDPDALAAVIDKLAGEPDTLAAMGQNAADYFRNEFHWEKQSRSFYDALAQISSKGPAAGTITPPPPPPPPPEPEPVIAEEPPAPPEPDRIAIRYGTKEIVLPGLAQLLMPAILIRRAVRGCLALFKPRPA